SLFMPPTSLTDLRVTEVPFLNFTQSANSGLGTISCAVAMPRVSNSKAVTAAVRCTCMVRTSFGMGGRLGHPTQLSPGGEGRSVQVIAGEEVIDRGSVLPRGGCVAVGHQTHRVDHPRGRRVCLRDDRLVKHPEWVRLARLHRQQAVVD